MFGCARMRVAELRRNSQRQAHLRKNSPDTAAKTRSPAQKPACKDLRPKWLKPSHLGLRPLTLRFLTAL
ncbi:hypothetical protein BVJ53_11005 [Lacticaseibacillus chiayiensis]|uniref:Uncharacterized protein n=1 Tax=Lacticaseibacillus chiayiensis TaxID=2100821 RepID=A0A4Q1TPK7_9LACO|nr:hypothetical protein BVJ53_11005 [Lacticaseibacillus chiayiensis]